MKKIVTVCFLLCVCFLSQSQKDFSNSLQLELGRPMFLDGSDLNGFGVGIHYTYELSNSFEVSAFYNNTRGNDFPAYGRDMAAIRDRFIGQNADNFLSELPYQQIENNLIGVSIGWLFINNNRWKYGVALGGGLVLSNKSEVSSVVFFQTSGDENQTLLDFSLENTEVNYNGTFFRLAMDVDYTILERYSVGLSINYLTHSVDFDPSGTYILANHLMPSLKVGYKF